MHFAPLPSGLAQLHIGPPKKVAPPPKAAHAPCGRIITMSARNPFHSFCKLKLIKREKFKNNSLHMKYYEYLSNLQINKPKKVQHVCCFAHML